MVRQARHACPDVCGRADRHRAQPVGSTTRAVRKSVVESAAINRGEQACCRNSLRRLGAPSISRRKTYSAAAPNGIERSERGGK
jgi:hypothetical protein